MKFEYQFAILSIIGIGMIGYLYYSMFQDVGIYKTLLAIGLLCVLVFGTLIVIFGKDLFKKSDNISQRALK